MNEQGSWTFWLMLTNLALAAVVLGSALIVVLGVVWEFLKPRARTTPPTSSSVENEPAALPPEMSNIDEELAAMLREETRRILAEESRLAMIDAREAVTVSKSKPGDPSPRK